MTPDDDVGDGEWMVLLLPEIVGEKGFLESTSPTFRIDLSRKGHARGPDLSVRLGAEGRNVILMISFRDLFLESVGNNSTFSDSQNLQYLKLSVKGEAATLLLSIQITNDNYKKAWNALTECYENEAEIINAALNKLVLQPVLKQESASGLRKLQWRNGK
ncbi:uncharacterized protein TNCV_5114301 [Trichonephila clavipes]|nr:uncharacterized protein TNCV_5114301 [Trichonephila clavipes]